MTYFHFGSLTIPAIWVTASIALVTVALLNRAIARKKVGDWYWNGFFLYFLVWKLSYIIFQLKMFLDMPFSVVYFNGGIKGHLVALAILSFYLLFIAVKKHPSIYEESAHIILLYFICYEVILNLLEKNIVGFFAHLLLLVAYLILIKKKKKISSQFFILFMLLGLLVMSFFNTMLSLEALTFIWLGMTVLIFSKKPIRSGRKLE